MDLHEKAIKLWEYLAETGALFKMDAYSKLGLEYDENSCPACQYTYELRGHLDCTSCPVRDSWVRSDGIGFVNKCEDKDSAFRKWCVAEDDDERKRFAGLVLESVRDWWEEVE